MLGFIIAKIRRLEDMLSLIGTLLMLALMLLGAWDVIGRYVFNSPVKGAMEISRMLMGGTVFLTWAYAHRYKSHVTVDIFFMRYPPRLKAALSFIMMLGASILFVFIMWYSAKVVIMDWEMGTLVQTISIPIALFKFMVPLGALLMFLECLIQMLELAPGIFKEKEG